MPLWLPAAIGYALAIGTVGIIMKLALRTFDWPVLVLSSALGLGIMTVVLALIGASKFPIQSGLGWVWVVLAGMLGAAGLPLFALALETGPASKVVPVGAGYVVVTVVLAAIFLAEPVRPVHALGIVLIVGGAFLVSR